MTMPVAVLAEQDEVALPAQRPASGSRLLGAAAFIVPLLVSVGLHWSWLGYCLPFGGQQMDDDYHYYSFAARLDAEHPRDLQAYRPEVLPDRVTHQYDAARVTISFSKFWPYPGWAVALHEVARWLHLSYPMAAFALFIIQTSLALLGAQWLAAAMAPPGNTAWWRLGAGLIIAMFAGIDGVASTLNSIPMNMANALSLAALGAAVSRRWRLVTAFLAVAATIHVASITVAAYVLFTAMVYGLMSQPRDQWKTVVLRTGLAGLIVVGVWTAVYYGIFDMGKEGMSDPVWFRFARARLSFLFRGQGSFFPIIGSAALVACWCAVRAGGKSWQVPAACLVGIALTGVAFLFLENQHVNHLATLHPLSRFLYYMAPRLLILATLLAAARAIGSGAGAPVRGAALACAVLTLAVVARQNGLVFTHQFAVRAALGLGPLHARLSQLSHDPMLSRTAFVFYKHEYGTVLSAAHLYDARYLWKQVYSAQRLQEATEHSQRVIYLEEAEGTDPPLVRIPGFCPVSEEMVPLGLSPGQPGNTAVHMVQAERC